MRKILHPVAGILTAIAVTASVNANAITLDYSSAATISTAVHNPTLAHLQFQSGGFSFVNNSSGADAGYSYIINDGGDSLGDLGNIVGTFKIGAITISGGEQSAPVTGTGTVNISDGSDILKGTVTWDSISTLGTGGSINVSGLLNLTGITYSGTQSDLLALLASGVDSDVVSFSFTPGETLTELKAGTFSTAFSGQITTVPDGGLTASMLGMGLLGIGYLRRLVK